MPETVLITGAQGNIGKKLQAHLQGRYQLKLLDIVSDGHPSVVVQDLSKWDERLTELFEGVDAVVHLAGDPYETKSWAELSPPNLDALNNVFMAAIKSAVPRVVLASSNHVMGGYQSCQRAGRWLNTELEPKPGTHCAGSDGIDTDSTPYGAMKLFGERMGLAYAVSTSSVCIAIRIGWVNRVGDNLPEDLPAAAIAWYKRMWLSTRDMCQLIEQSITVPKPPGSFLLVNGMSDNEGMVWDIDYTRQELGYLPQDGLTLDFKSKR